MQLKWQTWYSIVFDAKMTFQIIYGDEHIHKFLKLTRFSVFCFITSRHVALMKTYWICCNVLQQSS